MTAGSRSQFSLLYNIPSSNSGAQNIFWLVWFLSWFISWNRHLVFGSLFIFLTQALQMLGLTERRRRRKRQGYQVQSSYRHSSDMWEVRLLLRKFRKRKQKQETFQQEKWSASDLSGMRDFKTASVMSQTSLASSVDIERDDWRSRRFKKKDMVIWVPCMLSVRCRQALCMVRTVAWII